MILKLVNADEEILRQKATAFDFKNPQVDPVQLAKDLYETMIEHKALGLSAPQVGLPFRVFSMYAVPGIVCFNPRVVDETTEDIVLEEGCVTFPNLLLNVKRARRIKVRYIEPNGNPVTRVFDGMAARVFLHELDHMDGMVFTKRANKIHLERALRKKKQLDRQQKREDIQ